ncbi:MAG: helix-turn-helix transcriptional regulator [Cyanobacteria bacterium P01_D01_bin.56]
MANTPNQKFVSKLKELGIRPEVIAVALDKSANSVYSWRSGKHMPRLTPREMATFCELLGVSIDELAEMFDPSVN